MTLTFRHFGATNQAELDIPGTGELEEISKLTIQCTLDPAQPSAGGFVRAYDIDLLNQLFALPGTRAIVAYLEQTPVGVALYHLDQNNLPAFFMHLGGLLSEFKSFGLGHFVAVHPDYRGSQFAIYDQLLTRAGDDAASTVQQMLSLVRIDNAAGLQAHTKRGWKQTGIKKEVLIEGREITFEVLLMALHDNQTLKP